MPARTRPIQKFAAAVSQCSPEVCTRLAIVHFALINSQLLHLTFNPWQAAVYGRCIVADYNSVHKDKCVAEFMKLKDCYLVSLHQLGPYMTC